VTPPGAENVVLIGLMGAGKSTVGARLADRLRWRFVDLDDVIERRSGRTIADLFEHSGEPAFRKEEREAAIEVLAATQVVLAAGGGWAAQPGSLESLPSDTLSVWLRVSPEEAVRRIEASGVTRPLLNPARKNTNPMNPKYMLETARSLAVARKDRYALAEMDLDTEAFDVDRLAESIAKRIEEKGLES